MAVLKRCYSLFFNSKLLYISSIIFILATSGYLIFTMQFPGTFSVLKNTNFLPIFYFIFFAFLSYEYFTKAKKVGLKETLGSAKHGTLKVYSCQLAVLFTIALICFALVLLINLIYYFTRAPIQKSELLFQIITNITVNILLVSVLGMFIALTITILFGRKSGYIVLAIFAVLTSPLLTMLTNTAFIVGNINIAWLSDFFNFYQPSTDYGLYSLFGYTVLPYQLWHICTFIFLGAAVLLFCCSKKSERSIKLAAGLNAVICVVTLGLFLAPSSKYQSGQSPSGTAHDVYLYLQTGVEEKEEPADFEVTQYNMDIDIKDLLKVTVSMAVSKNNQEQYNFTLYHGYNVSKITDQSGNKLNFKQYSDYVEVYNPEKKHIDEIVFKYKGYSTREFSNRGAIRLFGSFPYYPQAGFHKVFKYDFSNQCCNPIALQKDAQFNAKISYPSEFYTNLEKNADGTYSGTTTGVTIVAGLLEKKTINGIECVYPYLQYDTDEENLKQQISELSEKRLPEHSFKKIFFIPGTQSNPLEDNYVFSDHMVSSQPYKLYNQYLNSLIGVDKVELQSILNTFTGEDSAQRIEYYVLKSDAEIMRSHHISYNPYKEIDKTIKKFGKEKAVEQIENYIYDLDDTRTPVEFFKELTEG